MTVPAGLASIGGMVTPHKLLREFCSGRSHRCDDVRCSRTLCKSPLWRVGSSGLFVEPRSEAPPKRSLRNFDAAQCKEPRRPMAGQAAMRTVAGSVRQRLERTQSEASAHLLAPRRRSKIQLVERRTTGCILTSAGEALVAAAERAESEFRQRLSQILFASALPMDWETTFLPAWRAGCAASRPAHSICSPAADILAVEAGGRYCDHAGPSEAGSAHCQEACRLHALRLRGRKLSEALGTDQETGRSRRSSLRHACRGFR
jgi:hypothetical protein